MDIVKSMALLQLPGLFVVSAIVVQIIVSPPLAVTAAPQLFLKGRGSSTNNPLLSTPITKIHLPDSVVNLTNTVGSPDFPPGPQPPRDVWPVHLRYTDPDVWLLFHDFDRVASSNDTQVEQALQEAIMQSSNPRLRSQFMEPREYVWSQAWDRTVVVVKVEVEKAQPSEEPPHPEIGLTFGIWTSCLIAINRFRLTYPGLYPQFNIIIKPGRLISYNVGHGQLRAQLWPQSQGTAPSIDPPTADPSTNALTVTKRSFVNPIVLINALPNSSVTGTNLTGVVGASDLPPGTEPPEEVWYYDIRFTQPQMTLKFWHYDRVDGLDQTEIEGLIQQAIRATIDRRLQNQFMDSHEYVWAGNQILLFVEPYPVERWWKPPHELIGLTYGMWQSCLIGINQFRLAYPVLDFLFEIYVDAGEDDEKCVGKGGLVLKRASLQAPATTTDDVAVTKRSRLDQIGGRKDVLPNDSIMEVSLTSEPGALL